VACKALTGLGVTVGWLVQQGLTTFNVAKLQNNRAGVPDVQHEFYTLYATVLLLSFTNV
jgi:hypothetical protein